MVTDITLGKHVNNYIDICEKIKALEEAKKEEANYILCQMDDRQIEKFGAVKIMTRTTEKADKKKMEAYFGNNFEEVWNAVKSVTNSRFIQKTKG